MALRTSPTSSHPWIIGASALLALAGSASAQLGAPPAAPPENPPTEAKRVLGKVLFWDEQLSTSNTVACATCHIPARGGTDPRRAAAPGLDGVLGSPDDTFGSPGVIHSDAANDYVRDAVFALAPQVTPRAANSAINAAYFTNLFWDGRATPAFTNPETGVVTIPAGAALESQAAGPPVSSVEMAHDAHNWSQLTTKLARVRPLEQATALPPDVASALTGGPSYQQLFQNAFGDATITAERIAMAIATYERTLIADQTPYDNFRRGQTTALNAAQLRGLNAFTARACVTCHAEPLFADPNPATGFRNVGLRPPAEDSGRQAITGLASDRGKFKVPSLRNANLKTSFMHTGQFVNLGQVMGFYVAAAGVPQGAPTRENRDPLMDTLNPQVLPPPVVNDIIAFLSGGLTDPRVQNEQFPFDRPTLYSNRTAQQPTIFSPGTAGSGGIVPAILVQSPPMLGTPEFRVGLFNARGGAAAKLGVSRNTPVGGRIVPEEFLFETITSGVGNGNGMTTFDWNLLPSKYQQGEVWFAQWFITDPGAVGGEAVSSVGRVPIFCGVYGCPAVKCNLADLTGVGGAPAAADNQLTVDDLIEFVNLFSGAEGCPGPAGLACNLADLTGIGGPPEAPDGQLTVDDLIAFVNAYSEGC